MRTRISRSLVVLAVLSVAMVIAPAAVSYPTGVNGVAPTGCNCHGAVANSDVAPSISGLPDQYNYSEEYEIVVSFTGGPADAANSNQGGFNLWVSDGELVPNDATVQAYGANEVSHTEAGNDQTSWTMTWTAPSGDRNVEFILHVNSVNGNEDGNNGGSSGDMWNRLSAKVSPPILVLEQADPFVVLSTLIVVSAVLLIITLTYVFYRTNPESFTWEYFAPWISEWLTSTDHKKIGTLYFVAGSPQGYVGYS